MTNNSNPLLSRPAPTPSRWLPHVKLFSRRNGPHLDRSKSRLRPYLARGLEDSTQRMWTVPPFIEGGPVRQSLGDGGLVRQSLGDGGMPGTKMKYAKRMPGERTKFGTKLCPYASAVIRGKTVAVQNEPARNAGCLSARASATEEQPAPIPSRWPAVSPTGSRLIQAKNLKIAMSKRETNLRTESAIRASRATSPGAPGLPELLTLNSQLKSTCSVTDSLVHNPESLRPRTTDSLLHNPDFSAAGGVHKPKWHKMAASCHKNRGVPHGMPDSKGLIDYMTFSMPFSKANPRQKVHKSAQKFPTEPDSTEMTACGMEDFGRGQGATEGKCPKLPVRKDPLTEEQRWLPAKRFIPPHRSESASRVPNPRGANLETAQTQSKFHKFHIFFTIPPGVCLTNTLILMSIPAMVKFYVKSQISTKPKKQTL